MILLRKTRQWTQEPSYFSVILFMAWQIHFHRFSEDPGKYVRIVNCHVKKFIEFLPGKKLACQFQKERGLATVAQECHGQYNKFTMDNAKINFPWGKYWNVINNLSVPMEKHEEVCHGQIIAKKQVKSACNEHISNRN